MSEEEHIKIHPQVSSLFTQEEADRFKKTKFENPQSSCKFNMGGECFFKGKIRPKHAFELGVGKRLGCGATPSEMPTCLPPSYKPRQTK